MHRPNTLQLAVVVVLSFQWLAQGKEAGVKHPTLYRTVQVDGLSIFYREAGPKDAPTILLLHGIPELPRVTSSERNRISFYRSQVVGRTFLIKIHDAASFAF